jgi:outer membrane receptor protein involved in Fe transport
MSWNFWKTATLTALSLCFFALMSAAQTIVTGGFAGTITDPTGAVVPGVALTAKNVATGETYTTVSTATGGYVFSLLKPGEYSLSASKEGFKTSIQNVNVELGQNATLNFTMELGASSTTVEVTGVASLLQTQNANISTTFDTRQVLNLPNPGNDLTNIAQTAPGVTMNTSSGVGYGNFVAFGMPGTSNLFTINGNDYNDPFLNLNNSGASNLLLGTNDVQEVAVVSNGYTGQYGRMAGAQVDYTTKSGTNTFHGDAMYFWTGSALNAEDYFLKASGQPKPFQNNNQWAANFGGPIKKNKAYFFLDNEGIRYTLATATQSFLPTPAFQSYVLSSIPAAATGFYDKAFGFYNGAKGAGDAVPQANTCPGIGGATVNALPSGSTECLSSVTLAGSAGNQEWFLVGRVDYSFSDNDKIFGRVKFDRGTQPTYADPISPLFNAISHQPQDEGQLNWTHIFSPTVANNFIFSDLWYSAVFQSTNVQAANAAFPVILCSSNTSLSCLGAAGGEFPFGFFFPQGRNVEQYQFVDDLSVERGKHTFKMGVNFRRDDISDYRASELTLTPAISTSLAGFATDTVDTSTNQNFATSSPQPLAMYSFGLYFQDEVTVSQKLKLTLALRADRNSGGICQHDCSSIPALPFQDLSHDATIPYNQMVDVRSSVLRDIEKVVLQPRVGFAWSPTSKDTVIRGGVGLFSDLYPGTILDSYSTNFPQVLSFSVPGGTVDPSQPGSGVSIVQGCNTAFRTVFNSGQTVGQYAAAAPQCAAALPPLNDVTSQTLNPKFVEWNLEVQRTLAKNTLFSINYVGNYGYDILLTNPYLNAFCTTGICGSGFTALPPAATDGRVSTVLQLTNNGHSNYNGVVASLQQNLWNGLTFRLNYTYSHSLDNVSNGGVLPFSLNDTVINQIDPANPNLQYGSSDYDARHQVSANYVWALPIHPGNRLLNFVVGGWQISGTFFYRTGFPFSMLDGQQSLAFAPNNTLFEGLPEATVLLAPSQGQSTSFGASCAVRACFSTSSFATPTDFNAFARNAFRGPGYFNTDMNLLKSFSYRERYRFEIGANFFNLLNHPNFQNPVNNNTNSAFGTINALAVPPTTPYGAFASAAEGMRITQVFAKLFF